MKKLNVVFKTHLDIGFTDLAENVVQQYLYEFIPQAVSLSEDNPNHFVWTVGSWLVDYYLKNEKVEEQEKERLIKAIKTGNISWHGLPFTTHTEFMDKMLFQYGLSIGKKLDTKFGKETISAKMTDVPGHTIGIVPVLAKAGIKYLHIGVNPSSAVPDVPEIFLWRDKDGNELVVHYDAKYGGDFVRDDWEEGLYFVHSNDNMGPPANNDELMKSLDLVKKKYPDYEIVVGDLNDFAEYAWSKKADLPVITEEIGDSWIHGVGSDPEKMYKYRALLRLKDKWLEEGSLTEDSVEYDSFMGALALIPEHTWGANANLYLPDYKNYLLEDFHAAKDQNNFNFEDVFESLEYSKLMSSINMYVRSGDAAKKSSYKTYQDSWEEQRNYLNQAIDSLSGTHKNEVMEEFRDIEQFSVVDSTEKVVMNKLYSFGNMNVSFDSDGSINRLRINNRELVINGKLGCFSYERFDNLSYQKYLNKYSRINQDTGSWVFVDFAKRGIETIPEITHEKIFPFVENSSIEHTDSRVIAIFDLKFNDEDQNKYGLPKKIQLVYSFDLKANRLKLKLLTNKKEANRMPEAYWLETSLSVGNPYKWQLHKFDYAFSPYDVVHRGNRQIHALDDCALTYKGSDGMYEVSLKHSNLVSIGGPNLLNFDDDVKNMNDGIYVNLYNNVWGTNFPAWYEGSLQSEILLDFDVNRSIENV